MKFELPLSFKGVDGFFRDRIGLFLGELGFLLGESLAWEPGTINMSRTSLGILPPAFTSSFILFALSRTALIPPSELDMVLERDAV